MLVTWQCRNARDRFTVLLKTDMAQIFLETICTDTQFLDELHTIVQICRPKAPKAAVAMPQQFIHLVLGWFRSRLE